MSIHGPDSRQQLAGGFCETGRADSASQLLGASEAILASNQAVLDRHGQSILAQHTKNTKEKLDAMTYKQAFEKGKSLDLQNVMELVQDKTNERR